MARYNKRKRFIEGKHYFVNQKNGCWEWLQCLNTKGYATTSINSVLYLASRVFYSENIGRIQDGLVIDHLCRNPKCVNPNHLEAVTQGTNVRRGKRTKLSIEDVEKIRASRGKTQIQLAKLFEVGQDEISRIINYKRFNYEQI